MKTTRIASAFSMALMAGAAIACAAPQAFVAQAQAPDADRARLSALVAEVTAEARPDERQVLVRLLRIILKLFEI